MYKYNVRTGLKKIRTKMFIAISALGLILSGGGMSLVNINSVHAAPGDWSLNASSIVVFSCGGGDYSHTFDTIVPGSSGNFTGTGHYNPNNSYFWDLNGNITGNNITFTITYMGAEAGSVYISSGTIASDGSISGITDSNCQSFSMVAGSASKEPQTYKQCRDALKLKHKAFHQQQKDARMTFNLNIPKPTKQQKKAFEEQQEAASKAFHKQLKADRKVCKQIPHGHDDHGDNDDWDDDCKKLEKI